MDKILSLNLLKKYRLNIAIILFVSVAIGVGSILIIKPRFKVTSVISISPSYFQNSLMREFLSEVYDPAELRSQRQSIMSEALDKNFLDEISEASGEVKSAETPQQAALRRMSLLKSIDIVSLQSSDFQISVTGTDRDQAMALNQKVIDNILTVLKEKRTKSLSSLRTAIATQLDSMIPTKGLINANVGASSEALRNRIGSLEAQLAQLQKTFSDSHPSVKEAKNKLAEVKSLYAAAGTHSLGDTSSYSGSYEVKGATTDGSPRNTVYDDLVRKYRYLNVVLLAESSPIPPYFSVVRSPEYPLSAIWPKKGLFLIWSVLLGVLASLAYIGVREYLAAQSSSEAEKQRKYSMANAQFIEADKKPKSAPALNHDIQP